MAETYALTPEQCYDLMVAALNVVGGVSPGVHKRCRGALDNNHLTSYPGIRPGDLVALVDVLNGIRPGIADKVIQEEHDRRTEYAAKQKGGK